MIAPSDNVEVSPEESDNRWRWRAIRSLHAKMVQAAVEPNLQTLCIVLEVCSFLLFGSDPAATVTAVQAHLNEGSDHSRLVDELLSKADDVSVVLAPRLLAALGPIAALPRPTDSAVGRWIQMAADLAVRSDRDRFRHGAVLVAADGSTVRGADPLRCVHPAVTTVRAPHRVHARCVPSSQRTMFWHPGVSALCSYCPAGSTTTTARVPISTRRAIISCGHVEILELQCAPQVMHAEVHALVTLKGAWARAIGATIYIVEVSTAHVD